MLLISERKITINTTSYLLKIYIKQRANIYAATVCCLELGSLFWVSKIIISLH